MVERKAVGVALEVDFSLGVCHARSAKREKEANGEAAKKTVGQHIANRYVIFKNILP